MALLGRAAFWPFRPELVPEDQAGTSNLSPAWKGQKGIWRATGSLVSRRPAHRVDRRPSLCWLVALGRHPAAQGKRRPADGRHPYGIQCGCHGQGRTGAAFRRRQRQPRGGRRDESKAEEVLAKVKAADGVGDAYLLAAGSVPITGAPGTRSPSDPDVREGKVLINATLNYAADSTRPRTLCRLREELKRSTPVHWWAA